MSWNIIVGESVLLLPSPGQVKMPLSMAELAYIGKKNNLDLLLAMTQTLLLDQNVGSDRLDEARGELREHMDAFRPTYDGLSKSQRRKTQGERRHLYDCFNDCMGDLHVAIRLKREQEKQEESEPHQHEVAADAADQEVPKEQESEPHQYEVAAAVKNEKDLPQSSGKLSEVEFCKKDSESGEAAVKNDKDFPPVQWKAQQGQGTRDC